MRLTDNLHTALRINIYSGPRRLVEVVFALLDPPPFNHAQPERTKCIGRLSVLFPERDSEDNTHIFEKIVWETIDENASKLPALERVTFGLPAHNAALRFVEITTPRLSRLINADKVRYVIEDKRRLYWWFAWEPDVREAGEIPCNSYRIHLQSYSNACQLPDLGAARRVDPEDL